MHVKVDSNKLRDSVGRLLSVVDKKNSRPILTNCHFKVSGNTLFLQATDLEVSTKLSIDAEVIEDGEFCINPKNIRNWSSKICFMHFIGMIQFSIYLAAIFHTCWSIIFAMCMFAYVHSLRM